ncbi:hypothetical protein AB1Y20_010717 [Prymnesium parvum]|uniref:Transmembrane 9 superfamily member n=1 Tax=Prymnesium parvum TaxID=97485 RepID=A0AB34ITK7_PRYPA
MAHRLLTLICGCASALLAPPCTPPRRCQIVTLRRGTAPVRRHAAAGALMVAAPPPQNRAAVRTALAPLLRPLRWLLSALARIVRAVLGVVSQEEEDSDTLIDSISSGSASKMLLTTGIATRSVTPPEDAYLYFDYTFSPFYSSVPVDVNLTIPRTANSSVQWLRWADAKPLTDLEMATDMGRLELLRRIVSEAIEIEKANQRRQLFNPFYNWFDNTEPKKRSMPDLYKRVRD